MDVAFHVDVVFEDDDGLVGLKVVVVGDGLDDGEVGVPACDPGGSEDRELGDGRVVGFEGVVLRCAHKGW